MILGKTLAGLAAVGLAPIAAFGMELTSSTFEEGATLGNAQVFKGFGCEGGNVSPALAWSGVPEETKSLALTMYDPDAPTGSGWWHWVVVNLPADATELAEGASGTAMPEGALETRTDFGVPGYGGPCPPEGDAPHHYIFTMHALGADSLPLDAEASGAMAGFMINGSELDKATLTGLYGR
jgi:Raf kinase inhibitor-like YbhB/YbcL family protein